MTRAWAPKLDEGTTQDKIGGSALHLQDLLASLSSFSDQADVGLGIISAAEKAAYFGSPRKDMGCYSSFAFFSLFFLLPIPLPKENK